MRYDSLSSWQKALEQPNWVWPCVSFMISAEPYVLDLAWQSLLEALRRSPKWSSSALCLFDCEENETASLFDELQTLPFLVPFKVIVLRRAEKLTPAERKRLDSLLTANIEAHTLAKQNNRRFSQIYVVVMAAQCPKSNSLYKACQEQEAGALLEVVAGKGAQREAPWVIWVQQRMQLQGKTFPFGLAKQLVHELSDLSYLPTECDKLLAYIGERATITQADLEAVCTLTQPESIWQLGEAICKGDLAKALAVTDFLLENDLSPFALLASLKHQLQTGCRVAELLEAGTPQTKIASEFPQLIGRLLDNQCHLAKEYGASAFRRALERLTEMEFHLKDRPIDPHLLMQRLIFLISQRSESIQIT